jgi:hypothetical protein
MLAKVTYPITTTTTAQSHDNQNSKGRIILVNVLAPVLVAEFAHASAHPIVRILDFVSILVHELVLEQFSVGGQQWQRFALLSAELRSRRLPAARARPLHFEFRLVLLKLTFTHKIRAQSKLSTSLPKQELLQRQPFLVAEQQPRSALDLERDSRSSEQQQQQQQCSSDRPTQPRSTAALRVSVVARAKLVHKLVEHLIARDTTLKVTLIVIITTQK